MISQSHFDNIPARNTLSGYKQKNLTNEFDNSQGSYVENMIINSNLDNENVIK